MKKSTKTKILILSVLRTIVGIALINLSIMLYESLHLSGQLSFLGTNAFLASFGLLVVLLIEWVPAIAGTYMAILGGLGLAKTMQ